MIYTFRNLPSWLKEGNLYHNLTLLDYDIDEKNY